MTEPRRAGDPPSGEPRLSVVVPAFREAAAIRDGVGRIRSELRDLAADGGLEVVVVDDGSGDGTTEAAHEAGADQVLTLPVNSGKGAAVRAGMLAATGATRAFTDADLSYTPAQIASLVTLVEAGFDVVVGNRYDPASTTVVDAGLVRKLGGRAINLATRAVLHEVHPDTQCGLKAFRSDVAEVLFGHSVIDGFAFDVELIYLVERYGLSLASAPVEVVNTETSTVHVVRDAVRLLGDLARIRREARAGHYDLGEGERGRLALRGTLPGE